MGYGFEIKVEILLDIKFGFHAIHLCVCYKMVDSSIIILDLVTFCIINSIFIFSGFCCFSEQKPHGYKTLTAFNPNQFTLIPTNIFCLIKSRITNLIHFDVFSNNLCYLMKNIYNKTKNNIFIILCLLSYIFISQIIIKIKNIFNIFYSSSHEILLNFQNKILRIKGTYR